MKKTNYYNLLFFLIITRQLSTITFFMTYALVKKKYDNYIPTDWKSGGIELRWEIRKKNQG